jgi:hypothetical protein
MGIANQLHFDGEGEQSPFALSREYADAARHGQGEACSIGEGHSVLLGWHVKFGAGLSQCFIKGHHDDGEAAHNSGGRLAGSAALDRLLQNFRIIHGGHHSGRKRRPNDIRTRLRSEERNQCGGIEDNASHGTTGEAQGLAATWQPVSYHSTIPDQVTYEALGDRLKMSTNQGVVLMAALDGKPVAVTGPAVISGTMVALKLIDAQTMENAQSREGVPTGKQTVTISADGKLMTVTAVNLAPNASREPSVTVFEKQ